MLEKIKSVQDFKNIEEKDLPELCYEIRQRLISVVSKNGGHLASNLGTVELTVALDRFFDPEKDRIVFDVGHQSYVHKLLTGRNDQFDTLRQFEGLSGFPKPSESDADAFIAGHSSNSISIALGMAKARSLNKEDYKVVAVIGDGALTGGEAYEGLSNAALAKEKMIIILNDNEMSISPNVGGIARYLSDMRTKPSYFKVKKLYHGTIGKVPFLNSALYSVKEKIKHIVLDDNIFVDLGFDYIGPVDGNDIGKIESALKYADSLSKSVVVHVITKKGKGYKPAEDNPSLFHGIGKFNPVTGIPFSSKESYAKHFGNALTMQALEDSKVVAITAAMSEGTGLNAFRKALPERFFDVGIAEQTAVSLACGMAKQGLIPVTVIYSTFLQRGYDQLIHDMSLQNLHVVLGLDHCGLVGEDGETHNGVFDISYLRSVPDLTLLAPASFKEMDAMLEMAIHQLTGPVAIRYPKGSEGNYIDCHIEDTSLFSEGTAATIVSYGALFDEVLKANEQLKEEGINCDIIKVSSIKPFNSQPIIESVKKTGHLLAVEDVCQAGSVGELALAALAGKCSFDYKLLNTAEGIVKQGSVKQLYHQYEIDAEGIVKNVKRLLDR